MQVNKYEIYLFHRHINYGSAGGCWTTAQVRCRDNAGKAALLVFYDPELTAAVPTSRGGSSPLIFIPANQYPWHVDLLRNESPLSLADDESKWWFGSLRTAGAEPVGEGE
ncbi:MAG TPA: hypothetical protein VK034_28135 [Enhygromyxa sp.]|nr:hypothetical protein [Enhygromyxa sp.]